jgi:hypothetical protein
MVSEDLCMVDVRKFREQIMLARDTTEDKEEMFRKLDEWSINQLIECDRNRRLQGEYGNGGQH